MQVDRAASLYIHGAEEALTGNEIAFTLRSRLPLDAGRVATSYERWVRARETLRLKWVLDQSRGAYRWEALSDPEVEARLARERLHLARLWTPDEAYSEYVPTNVGLTVRFRRVDARTLVASFNHMAINGRAGATWLEDWLSFYQGSNDASPSRLAESFFPARRWTSRFRRTSFAIRGILWTGVFLLRFWAAALPGTGARTVDLSRRPAPGGPRAGYRARGYSLSVEETRRLASRVRRARRFLVGEITAAMARLLLETQPDKERVCVSVPVDTHGYRPGTRWSEPGNFTASLPVQVFRGQDIEARVHDALVWARRGVPYYLLRGLGLLRSEVALAKRFAVQAGRPIAAQPALEGYSCVVSDLGWHRSRRLDEVFEWIGGFAKTPSIGIFCGRHPGLTLTVAVSADLFDPDEVFALTDRLVERLSSAPG